jgi:hypothetical protein
MGDQRVVAHRRTKCYILVRIKSESESGPPCTMSLDLLGLRLVCMGLANGGGTMIIGCPESSHASTHEVLYTGPCHCLGLGLGPAWLS